MGIRAWGLYRVLGYTKLIEGYCFDNGESHRQENGKQHGRWAHIVFCIGAGKEKENNQRGALG